MGACMKPPRLAIVTSLCKARFSYLKELSYQMVVAIFDMYGLIYA
jgi:hypothetical protein